MRKLKKDHVLVLRTNDKNNQSHGGFQYPSKVGAWVEAPDFIHNKECGYGLHGLLKGCQDVDYLHDFYDDKTLWMLLEVHKANIIDLNGKVKFRGGYIYFVGEKEKAIEILYYHYGNIGINFAKATSGDGGTSTSGNYGTSTSGNYGTSTSGNYGTSTSGNYGTSTSGYRGTSTSGDRGTIIIKYWDGTCYRFKVGYIGEDGLKPNTPYRLNKNNEFEEVIN